MKTFSKACLYLLTPMFFFFISTSSQAQSLGQAMAEMQLGFKAKPKAVLSKENKVSPKANRSISKGTHLNYVNTDMSKKSVEGPLSAERIGGFCPKKGSNFLSSSSRL